MDHSIEEASGQPEIERVSEFRQVLPQAIATGVNSLLFFSVGMLIGFPALLVPVFTALFGSDEASWYGAVTYICEPIGAMISGSFLQSLGCKKLMLIINVPLFTSWMLVYFAESTVTLHVANVCAGVTLGLVEAPAMRYISEMSHPSLRGVFMTCSSISVSAGLLFIFFLGSVTDWRNVALISAAVPVTCTILLIQVPETPMWLMSKGRPNAALNSLQWLRGWTSAEEVKEEFDKLEFYGKKKIVKILHAYGREVETKDEETSKSQLEVEGADRSESDGNIRNGKPRVSFHIEESEKRGLSDKWQDVTRREMLESMGKCFGMMGIMCLCGVVPMRPYLVQICTNLRLPMQPNWTAVWVCLLSMAGGIFCILVIRRSKKKPLLYFSFASCTLCLLIMGVIVKDLIVVEPLEPGEQGTTAQHWLSLVLLMAFNFCHSAGIKPITTMYLGEILPYRGRGVATGIVVSFYYFVTFVVVKVFGSMEEMFGLHSIFYIFATANIAGIFFTYFLLPETEGRYLSDIEMEITGRDSSGSANSNNVRSSS